MNLMLGYVMKLQVVVVVFLLFSCKKKEEVVTSDENTSSVVSLGDENKVFTVAELDNGITIKGGVEKSDTIPVSNSSIDLVMFPYITDNLV